MFKRKPQIQNLSPLRSSDRRKLADQVIADYHVVVPSVDAVSSSTSAHTPTESLQTTNSSTIPIDTNAKSSTTSVQPPTLASIRNSLLPESTQSARFSTLTGSSNKLIHGIVYVGSHADQSHTEKRILWIQYPDDTRLYPTVYTLWQNPGLVPLLHTQDFVVEKMQTGADLMTPGLVGGPPWPERTKTGQVVAVAGLGKHTVPTVVGVCKIDVENLKSVRGQKGAAVEGIHWEGDNIWSWSLNGVGGRKAPDKIEGWDMLQKDMQKMNMTAADGEHGDDEYLQDEEEDGGVALEASTSNLRNGSSIVDNSNSSSELHMSQAQDGDEEAEREDEPEPTTAEIDQSFSQAFLYSLYQAKQTHQPPNYGFDFPLQPSFLISNMIQPYFKHDPTSKHAGSYTIKKTSWKNPKKFIKHWEKKQLLKSKDRNGGETVILDIDFDDVQVKEFKPYRLPKVKAGVGDAGAASTGNGTSQQLTPGSVTDSSMGQKLSLVTVYRASAKLVPDLIPSKSTFYTSQQISNYLKTYIDNNPDLTDPSKVSSKRFVKLDPFIANNILGSNSSLADTKILAEGEIARDVLSKRILEDDHLCIPHWLLLPSDQPYDPEATPSHIKPKAGPAPKVHITIEKRTGTKLVTKISQLELFNINPHLLGPELQKKCAGSASVGQLVGGKPGNMEILVQGDQREVVKKELAKRGVDRRWIDVLDKSVKKK